MTQLHDLDATGQAALLQTGEVTSAELTSHHLERIEQLGARYGAFMTVTADQVMEAARRCDTRRARTPADNTAVRQFDGVPTAIKDLTPTAGTVTTMGSALMRDHVPETTAHVAALIEEAGFISVGKTNTPEFGLSSYTDNNLIGPARTPWDTSRNAGGSSGGAAAAVSAGLVPAALGSDGGGSIRIPASCCGIFGFKPTRSRVSSGPTGSDVSGLAGDGPLSRSVRDAAAIMDIIARPMPGDMHFVPAPATSFQQWVQREPRRLRIARWSQPYLAGIDASAESVAAWKEASALLESLGHEVVDVDNPFPPELEEQFNVVWSTGVAAVPLADESALRRNTRYWRDRGRQTSGIELAQAMGFLESACRDVLVAMDEFDAWLTPTLALPPQETGWFNESGDGAADHWRELQFTPYTAPLNMAGVPAASLPLYRTAASSEQPSLPIGIMLAGRPGDDGPLLSLCAHLERAAGWNSPLPG